MSHFIDARFVNIVNLFIQNKNNYLYGREISRKLEIPQKTNQNILNKLYQENILEKKSSGKNFLFKLNLKYISIDEILCLTEIVKLIQLKENFEISQIINDLKNKFKGPILIFGSFAKGYQNEESDLDILVISKDEKDLNKIQSKYLIKINTIYLSKENFEKNLDKNEEFSLEVLRNHIVVNDFEYFVDLWKEKYGEN